MADLLTDTQLKALADLKSQIEEAQILVTNNSVQVEDKDLIRFLRGRQFNVGAALTMFKEYAEWRHSLGKLSMSSVPNMIDTDKAEFWGVDKKGRPCIAIFPGKHKPGTEDVEELARVMTLALETLDKFIMRPPHDKVVVVFDYDNWGLGNVDTALDRKLMHVGQNYMPERLGTAFLVNPPWYFTGVWTVVKPFLDERTKEKIQFLGRDFQQQLLEAFDASQIPPKYGGTFSPMTLRELLSKYLDENGNPLSGAIPANNGASSSS